MGANTIKVKLNQPVGLDTAEGYKVYGEKATAKNLVEEEFDFTKGHEIIAAGFGVESTTEPEAKGAAK
jgi:hypothetical protein